MFYILSDFVVTSPSFFPITYFQLDILNQELLYYIMPCSSHSNVRLCIRQLSMILYIQILIYIK